MHLIKYEAARTALAAANSVDEVKQIKDKAEAIRSYAKQARDFDMANWAAEIRIRAERKLGEMIKAQKESGGMNKGAQGAGSNQHVVRSHDESAPKLSDLGITHSMSSRAQAIADVPEDEFEATISEHHDQQKELTSSTIRKLTQHKKREDKITEIKQGNQALPDKKYSVIYADPPWRYEHVKTESRAIENQYPTMSLDEIKALDIPASDDCVLFLWATSPKLAEAMEVLQAWGFDYRTCAVWNKKHIGMGYYFRQQHELLLVATKGNLPVPEPANRLASVFAFKRGEHSSKPHEVYDMISTMYPDFTDNRIELFCRTPQDGWDVWGNQSNGS